MALKDQNLPQSSASCVNQVFTQKAAMGIVRKTCKQIRIKILAVPLICYVSPALKLLNIY